MKTFQTYPADLQKLELEAIDARRKAAQVAPLPSGARDDTVGLCLSGGGIRSATFCLGFLQAMASRQLLRHVDWLSTVSGGGYIGTFLGRYYDRLRTIQPSLPPDVVERALSNPMSREIRWLRRHGEFLAPAGRTDWLNDVAIFVRNLLTLYLVLGTLLFGLYCAANYLRYGVLEKISALSPYLGGLSWQDLPIGYLVAQLHLGVFWSPWFMLVELFFLLAVLPQAIGYWLASQDQTEGFSRPTLIIVFAAIIGLSLASVHNGFTISVALLILPLLVSFWSVEKAWRRVRQASNSAGTGGDHVEQLRARTELTFDLAMYLSIGTTLAYFALIDTIGHALFEAYARHNVIFSTAIAQLVAIVAASLPILRGAGMMIANKLAQQPNPGLMSMILNNPLVAGLIAAALFLPPMVFLSYAAHAVFNGGQEQLLTRGLLIALGALAFSVVLAFPWAMPFVNRSSLHATYAARLARAYLGASNPRHNDNDLDLVVPGDDVDELTDYKPHEGGGPLHIINCCVNQTQDQGTLRSAYDRQGVSMACSGVAVSVSKFYHGRWVVEGGKTTVEPIGHVPGTPHPLLGADDLTSDRVESLPLRDWMSISGAAFGTGTGQTNNPARSLLYLLGNLRIGYWWDSGLSAGDRGTRPDVSFVRRMLWLLSVSFPTQSRLIAEGRARFAGPWERFWYLSDGGHFENLGGYEMVRRKVPFFVVLDATADADYDFDEFANFQRKTRIDFNAEIEPFGQEEWDRQTDADVNQLPDDQRARRAAMWREIAQRVGFAALEDGPFEKVMDHPMLGREGCIVRRHAFLFRIRYSDGTTSLLLYVKASMDGTEPVDVKHYYTENPDFPHESTAEQSFTEAQWESYRQLGQHVGDEALGAIESPSFLWLKSLR